MTNTLKKSNEKLLGFKNFLSQVRRDSSGLAVIEFAISLPFFMTLTIGGFELANYAQTLMTLNQITIHTADSAARITQGNPLTDRQVSEQDINDVFAGTIREGESLFLDGEHEFVDPSTEEISLRGNARIILSSVEPVTDLDPDNPKFRIRWQRCVGEADFYSSNFGDVDTATEIDSIGPDGQEIMPPDDTGLMFVELQYYFRPLIVNGFSKLTERNITQTASMVVRDKRDYSEILDNDSSVQKSICDGAGGGDDFAEDEVS